MTGLAQSQEDAGVCLCERRALPLNDRSAASAPTLLLLRRRLSRRGWSAPVPEVAARGGVGDASDGRVGQERALRLAGRLRESVVRARR